MTQLHVPEALGRLVLDVVLRARQEVQDIDPDYVQLLDELTLAFEAQLHHPSWSGDTVPEPSVRLSAPWSELLEAVFDLYQQAQTLCTVMNMMADLKDLRPDEQVGMRVDLLARDWNVYSQALVEKAIYVARRCIRRTDLARADKRRIESEGLEPLEAMQQQLEQVRDPLLHGEGGSGVIARAIGEIGGWEATVVFEQSMADLAPGIYEVAAENLQRWHAHLEQRTENVFELVSKVLNETLLDINWRDVEESS